MTTPRKPEAGESVTCTIMVTETNGALSVNAQIPDGADATLAGALTMNLLGAARKMMGITTGQIAPIIKYDK
jgi:hypothetical protein